MRRPSVIVVSHTPNQLIKHQGFLRRASEVHFEQTLSFIEIIFSYSTCGAKWCQRHVWVWQTIFWRSEKLPKKDGQYHWDELNYHQHCNNKTNTQMFIWMTVLWWNNNERNCITVKINWLVGIKYFQMHLVELFPLNQTWGGIPATAFVIYFQWIYLFNECLHCIF